MSTAKKRTAGNSAIAAPITVTITGNLAAAVRFLAYTDGVSVEQFALEGIAVAAECHLSDYNAPNGEVVEEWLMKKKKPRHAPV